MEHYLLFSLQYQENVEHQNQYFAIFAKNHYDMSEVINAMQCYLYYSELQTVQSNDITDWSTC